MNLLSTSRRTAAGALAALALASGAAAQTAFAPAIVVNDDVITYYDVEQRARLLIINGAPNNQQLGNAAAEQLIDDHLRAQAGKLYQLSASPEQIDAGVDEFSQRIGMDRATLLSRMKQAGVDRAALDSLIASQLVWRELVNGRFGSRATPSEVELDQEIALAASNQTKSYRLQEISLPAGRGQEAEAQAAIGRIMNELNRGGDFSRLARRYSRAPSAQNGGDVGWVPATVLPEGLADLIASTPPGGVTQPFGVPGGVSIFRVLDTRDEVPPWAREGEISLRQIRVPIRGEGAEAEAAAKRAAEDVVAGSSGCGSIPELEGEMTMESIDKKLVNALPAPVRDAVNLLQSGQASRPVRGDGTMDIFVVCERTGGVDDATRNQLRDQIRTQRLTRLSDGYLQSLRREAVIERR